MHLDIISYVFISDIYIAFPFRKVDMDCRHNNDDQISLMLQVNNSKRIVMQEKDDNEWLLIYHILPVSVQSIIGHNICQ